MLSGKALMDCASRESIWLAATRWNRRLDLQPLLLPRHQS